MGNTKRYKLLVLLTSILLSGCQTEAQHAASQIVAVEQEVYSNSENCFREVFNSADLSPIREKMNLGSDDYSLRTLTENSKANNTEKELIFVLNERVQPCRRLVIEGYAKTDPNASNIVASGYAATDLIYAKLIRGELTWGQFNTAMRDLRVRLNAALDDARGRVMARLEQQHYSELEYRQRVSESIQRSIENQQLINSLNRPRSVNCNRYGNAVSCTSY